MSDKDSSPSNRYGRRSALKLLSTAAVGLPLSATSVSGRQQRSADEEGIELPNPDPTLTTYGDSLYKVTSHPYLLTLPDDALRRWLDNSDLNGREFENALRYLENLRARYPVEQKQRGNELRYRLTDTARQNLQNERRSGRPLVEDGSDNRDLPAPTNKGLATMQTTTDQEYLKRSVDMFGGDKPKSEMSFGFKPLWKKSHHVNLLDEAANDIDSDANFASWAQYPDEFNQMANGRLDLDDGDMEIKQIPDIVPGKDWVEDKVGSAFKAAIDKMMKNYSQYYDPNVVSIPVPYVSDIKVGSVGMMDTAFDQFHYRAKTSSGLTKDRYVGWASHYIHDAAQPLHTGMGAEQAGITWDVDVDPLKGKISIVSRSSPKLWLHKGYEDYYRDNWEAFSEYWRGYEEKSYGSPVGLIDDIAKESSKYSDDIFNAIINNENSGTGWGDWNESTRDSMKIGIENSLTVGGAAQRGFLTNMGYGSSSTDPCRGTDICITSDGEN